MKEHNSRSDRLHNSAAYHAAEVKGNAQTIMSAAACVGTPSHASESSGWPGLQIMQWAANLGEPAYAHAVHEEEIEVPSMCRSEL